MAARAGQQTAAKMMKRKKSTDEGRPSPSPQARGHIPIELEDEPPSPRPVKIPVDVVLKKFCAPYLALAEQCRKVSEGIYSNYFNSFVMMWIIVAGVMAGVQTYPELKDAGWVQAIDLIALTVFIIEVVVKIVAEGYTPLRFFCGPEWRWNTVSRTNRNGTTPALT